MATPKGPLLVAVKRIGAGKRSDSASGLARLASSNDYGGRRARGSMLHPRVAGLAEGANYGPECASKAIKAVHDKAETASTGKGAHYTADAIEAGGAKLVRALPARDLARFDVLHRPRTTRGAFAAVVTVADQCEPLHGTLQFRGTL
jgi:hypothetical protein